VKGFSFGFKLNEHSFCILYEITDLSAKGLAQFIFREFCRQLPDYKYINIMDDSGLENLKQVKLSYHPVKLEPAYIVKRKNGQKY
ncbi:MAG: phosphatidylglycerol lysyltransferase domain-containing protein, partial [Candidatus Omnitrophota bacterium]